MKINDKTLLIQNIKKQLGKLFTSKKKTRKV